MIRPAEISKLAHRLGLGDKTIEKDYVLTWVLLAITASPLCDLLALKGGTAIKKMYVPDYRFSEDLDFTLLDDQKTNADLQMAVEGLFPWLARRSLCRWNSIPRGNQQDASEWRDWKCASPRKRFSASKAPASS